MFFLFNYHIPKNRRGERELELGKTCHNYHSDCARLKQGWKQYMFLLGKMSKAGLVSGVRFTSVGYQVRVNW